MFVCCSAEYRNYGYKSLVGADSIGPLVGVKMLFCLPEPFISKKSTFAEGKCVDKKNVNYDS
jgi:hypothetical protein